MTGWVRGCWLGCGVIIKPLQLTGPNDWVGEGVLAGCRVVIKPLPLAGPNDRVGEGVLAGVWAGHRVVWVGSRCGWARGV